MNSNRYESATADGESLGHSSANKYCSLDKAAEYAAMSWRHIDEHSTSVAFYDTLALLVREMSASARGQQPLLLEVGFGAGRFLYEMCEANSRATVVGIEKSEAMAEVARSVLVTMSPSAMARIILRTGDVQSLPAEYSETAAFTLCVNVLDRLESTSVAIAGLARTTCAGGTLLVVTALDYESALTPQHEQLDCSQIMQSFRSAGYVLQNSFWTRLHKVTKERGYRVFDELVLILRKKSGE